MLIQLKNDYNWRRSIRLLRLSSLLEAQLMKRRPEFQMDQILLDKIDYEKESLSSMEKFIPWKYLFPNDWSSNPSELTSEEKQIADSMLASSISRLPKLTKHIELLMQKGSMYKLYNQHLLFHGCIPWKPSGEFQPLVLHQGQYVGENYSIFLNII